MFFLELTPLHATFLRKNTPVFLVLFESPSFCFSKEIVDDLLLFAIENEAKDIICILLKYGTTTKSGEMRLFLKIGLKESLVSLSKQKI